jgi:hypothetical protein
LITHSKKVLTWSGTRSHFDMALGPAVLLAIVILFHWKLTLTHQYTWLENPDLANLVLPWMQFQAGEWHQHHFPLWDPNSWLGQPLFGQGQPGSAYPLNWMLFLAPLKNGWLRESVLNWYFVGVRYLAALAAYALARDLGRSRMASILAGCVYALGGYVASTAAPQMVNGAVWTPLVFLFLFRAERGKQPWASALLSGFFLGVGWLSGHHQMNLYVTIAAAALWAWLCVREGRLNPAMLKLAAASLAMAVLASGFQTVPMAEYGRLAVRWSGTPEPLHFNETVPYTVLEQYSLKPEGLLGVFLPNFVKGANPYVGVVAFTLALLGVILGWRQRQVRWLAALSLGGIIFALGPNGLLHGVLYALAPMLDKARVPGAGVVMFGLGIAPLAAYGLDLLSDAATSLTTAPWSRRAGWMLAAFGGLLVMLAMIRTDSDDRIMITALAAMLAAALFAALRGGGISVHACGAAALCLVLLELANVTDYALPNRSDRGATPVLATLSQHSDLADYIRAQGAAARVEYDDSLIQYNIGDWYGIEAVNAYTAGALTKIFEMDVFSPRAMNFLGVRFYLGKTPLRPGLNDVFTGANSLKVFENPDAYPRVWSVHAAATLPDRAEILKTMRDSNFDPRHTALLTDPAPEGIGECGSNYDDIQMPMHLPNYVQIRAGMQCQGMVILTDSSFPGWRAYVDGKRVPLLEAYGSVRGVVVPAGDHLVEMHYRPWSVLLGGLMTVCAAAIALIAARRA